MQERVNNFYGITQLVHENKNHIDENLLTSWQLDMELGVINLKVFSFQFLWTAELVQEIVTLPAKSLWTSVHTEHEAEIGCYKCRTIISFHAPVRYYIQP